MYSNFSFLEIYWSELADLGADAEDQLHYDNSACIAKIGVLAEKLTEEILYAENLEEYEMENQYDKIRILEEKGILPQMHKDTLHQIRMKRNSVSHDNELVSDSEASAMLHSIYRVAAWFAHRYSDKDFDIPIYRNPSEFVKNSVPAHSKTTKETIKPPVEKTEAKANKFLIAALILSVLLNIYLLYTG